MTDHKVLYRFFLSSFIQLYVTDRSKIFVDKTARRETHDPYLNEDVVDFAPTIKLHVCLHSVGSARESRSVVVVGSLEFHSNQ